MNDRLPPSVLGVDACPKGWVAALAPLGDRPSGCRLLLAGSISEIVIAATELAALAVIGIDIPIGLPTSGRRRADEAVRVALGARRSSLFLTPTRGALEATTYAEARETNLRLAGESVSAQSYALRGKILEVDRWLASGAAGEARVVEVHPETSFGFLNAEATAAAVPCLPLPAPKTSLTGVLERHRLLTRAGLLPFDDPDGVAARAGVAADDVLDAVAAAWTAARVARRAAHSFPGHSVQGADDSKQVADDDSGGAIWA